MISQLKSNLACKFAFLSLMSVFSASALAVSFNGYIRGGDINFINGVSVEGYWTTSNWQILDDLYPTTEWGPGTFIGTPEPSLVLSGESGESVVVDIKLAGLQYGLGEAASYFSLKNSPTLGAPCDGSSQNGSQSELIGFNCVGEKTYASDVSHTPFHFVRPLIELDKTDIVDAFRGSKVPSGVYTGTILTNPFYTFKSPSGSWTYRHGVTIPLTFVIRYEAASLESIDVIGDGVLQPKYDKVAHTISAGTKYRITASGFFSNGLKLTFSSDDDLYQISHESDDSLVIPYSVSCRQCRESDVVVNGESRLVDDETVVDGEDERIDVNLDVYFKDVPAADVETGSYNGSFSVLFEENLE